MSTVFQLIVFAFVSTVVGLTGYALYKMSPFAHHAERFRDDQGKRTVESLHL